MINHVDLNGKGEIEIHEFLALMQVSGTEAGLVRAWAAGAGAGAASVFKGMSVGWC